MGASLSIGYSTAKGVVLLDRKLGILYVLCITLVLAYVVGVRVVLEHDYDAVEKSYGVAAAQLTGTTWSIKGGKAVPQDVASLVRLQEGGALFLPTRWVITRDQSLGNCTSPDLPCIDDPDCPRDPPLDMGLCNAGVPTGKMYCMRQSWCNPDPGCGKDGGLCSSMPADPFSQGHSQPQVEEVLQNFSRLNVTIMSNILFEHLGSGCEPFGDSPRNQVPNVTEAHFRSGSAPTERGTSDCLSTDANFTLAAERYQPPPPTPRAVWDVASLIQRARLSEKDAQLNGAVLEVKVQWDCPNLFSQQYCMPTVKVQQLGNSTPFLVSWATYHHPEGCDPTAADGTDAHDCKLYRDLYQARGLRLLVRSVGRGMRLDVLQIVQQIFVALALFPIAANLADFIMQNLFSERRHYREYKTELSPDFSDVRAKVEQLEKQSQSRQAKAMNYA